MHYHEFNVFNTFNCDYDLSNVPTELYGSIGVVFWCRDIKLPLKLDKKNTTIVAADRTSSRAEDVRLCLADNSQQSELLDEFNSNTPHHHRHHHLM